MQSSYMKRWQIPLAKTAAVIFGLATAAWAGDPVSATYCQENDRIFWFMTITDTHIGTDGSQDTENLSWVVHEGKDVVNPSFIVLAGDITDGSNGSFIPGGGPYLSEWEEYNTTLDKLNTGINADNFFDIPGNHDAYNDEYFNYYLSNSVQGQATGRTQASWTYSLGTSKYHFLGANTSANDGEDFCLFCTYHGDYAGLDSGELDFLGSELSKHSDAELTLVFGHHPMENTGYSSDTWLFYGAPEFAALLEGYGVSSYTYGHTHRFSEAFFTSYSIDPGVFYININSLGKEDNKHFNVTAIDCNGISMVTQEIKSWPVVMITTPMDRNLGKNAHPLLGYTIPNGTGNPLRALLFDTNTSDSNASYRIDGEAVWHSMDRVETNQNLWEASWDSSGLNEGEHSIEVRAIGSEGAIRTDTITVYVEAGTTNEPPVANATAKPLSGTAPLNVDFNGTTSTDDGTIVTYLWDFGDGNTDDSGDMVTYVYQTAGSFNATLTVIDDQEAEATSEPIVIEVTPGLSTINAPTNLTAAVDGSSVSLNWIDNSSNETGFDIYRAEKIKGKYNYLLIGSVSTDVYTDTNVNIGTFKYKVQAKGSYAGEDIYSDFSNEVSVKVETSLPDPGTLSAPVLSTSISGLEVTLTWSHDCPEESICTYHVERGDAKVRGQIEFSEIASEVTSPYIVTEVSTGTYYYRVFATVEGGETSDPSNTVTVRLK